MTAGVDTSFSTESSSRGAERVRLFAQPAVVLLIVAGVLIWVFASDLSATEKETLNAAGLLAALRISSLAGITAAISAPVSAAFWGRIDLVVLFLALALVVLWKHRDNIDRLLSGTEPRIGKKRD